MFLDLLPHVIGHDTYSSSSALHSVSTLIFSSLCFHSSDHQFCYVHFVINLLLAFPFYVSSPLVSIARFLTKLFRCAHWQHLCWVFMSEAMKLKNKKSKIIKCVGTLNTVRFRCLLNIEAYLKPPFKNNSNVIYFLGIFISKQ